MTVLKIRQLREASGSWRPHAGPQVVECGDVAGRDFTSDLCWYVEQVQEFRGPRRFPVQMPKPIILSLVTQQEEDAERYKVLGVAFERACGKLGIAERFDPQRERVAAKVIELARLGERDLDRLTRRAVAAFLH